MRFVIDLLMPHQRAFREVLLVGGYGCGKTHIGALRLIRDSYVNAPVPHLYVSPSYKKARKTVVISIKELLDGAGVQYRFNKTNLEFAIGNWNGTIWIAIGDEPDSLKGPNIVKFF